MTKKNDVKHNRLAYRVDEAAVLLGISRTFIYRLIEKGDLKSFKLGRRRLVLKSDLDEFATSHAAEATDAC